MKINRTYGWIILIASLFYLHTETQFFGGHYFPSCAEEVIADGIGLLIASIGATLLSFNNKSN